MSDGTDDDPKQRQRTRVRKVANSRVPDPGRKTSSAGPQRTQIRRVKKNKPENDLAHQSKARSERTKVGEKESIERPSRSQGFKRSGPQQVREHTPRSSRDQYRSSDTQYRRIQSEEGPSSRKLLDEASALLALGGYLRTSDRPNDLDQLRSEIIEAVHRYRSDIEDYYGVGIVEKASKCVSAFLDDCVIGAIWSKGTKWKQGTVLASIHRQADRLDLVPEIELEIREGSDPDLIALYHTVLALGFASSDENGVRIGALREDAYRELRRLGHEDQRTLTAVDAIAADNSEGIVNRLPWWTILAGAAAIMVAMFLGIGQLQKPDVRSFDVKIDAALSQHKRLALVDFFPETYVPPVPQRLNLPALLAEDIAAERLRLVDADPGTRIIIRSDGMFQSSSSAVSGAFVGLITRIGQALDTTTGPIRVEGHTDNVPFRSATRTNQSLSTERASAVSQLLASSLATDSRLLTRGKADREPLVCNQGVENLAKNRRVEIILPNVNTPEAEVPLSPPVCGG